MGSGSKSGPPRRTIGSSTSRDNLNYIGALVDDEEGREKLALHASLLLAVLGAICQLDCTHTAIPWRVCTAIDPRELPALLEFMKEEWKFVTSVIDTLDSKDQLWRLFSHTRWQVYRDVMTKGEYLCCTCFHNLSLVSHQQVSIKVDGLYLEVSTVNFQSSLIPCF